RRQLLPRQSGLSGGVCDVVVGRYCYRQRAGAGPPPESPRVVDGRERLLDVLDSVNALLPNDRWILAQRVRYQLESDRAEAAAQIAGQCATHAAIPETRQWCRALIGYVAQRVGDYVHAD